MGEKDINNTGSYRRNVEGDVSLHHNSYNNNSDLMSLRMNRNSSYRNSRGDNTARNKSYLQGRKPVGIQFKYGEVAGDRSGHF